MALRDRRWPVADALLKRSSEPRGRGSSTRRVRDPGNRSTRHGDRFEGLARRTRNSTGPPSSRSGSSGTRTPLSEAIEASRRNGCDMPSRPILNHPEINPRPEINPLGAHDEIPNAPR